MDNLRKLATDLPSRRSQYKKPSISNTPDEIHARRLAQDASLRKRHRELLITSKRFKLSLDFAEDSEHEYDLSQQETESLREGLMENTRNKRIEALKTLSNVLTDPSEYTQRFVIGQDCVEILTGFLRSLDPDEQFQSLVALTNIAAGSPEMAEKMLPTIPDLIGFLDSQDVVGFPDGLTPLDMQNQAAWALGNLAIEGENFRDYLCANGVLRPLIQLLDSEDASLVQTSCFALSNLARGSNSRINDFFGSGVAKKLLAHLEKDEINETVSEICWVICYLTSGQETNATKILDEGLCPLLVQRMPKLIDGGPLAIPLIRTLGNITSGPDEHIDLLLNEKGFLENLLAYVKSDCRSVKKESLWTVSNITASRRPQVLEMVIHAGFIPVLSSIAAHTNFDIRKEAAFSLVHIASHGGNYAKLLPHDDLVSSFLDFVRSQDPELMRLGLTYFQLLLAKVAEAKKLIQGIPNSTDVFESIPLMGDEELYRISRVLVDRFFGDSEDGPNKHEESMIA